MKQLILLLTICLILGCTYQNNTSLPGQNIIEDVLINNIQTSVNQAAKAHADFPEDGHTERIYHQLIQISDTALQNFELINELDSNLSGSEIQARCNSILLNMYRLILDSSYADRRQRFPKMPTATSNKNENKILLLGYTNMALREYITKIMPYCGILNEYELKTLSSKITIKKGETFRCLNVFEGPLREHLKMYPLKLENILLNNKEISSKDIKEEFDNRLIEYTPQHPGKYTIRFSKKLVNGSGKVETYCSEISFEVIP